MGWYVGLDVGSFSCKAALLQEDELVEAIVLRSGTDYAGTARKAFEAVLAAAGLERSQIDRIVATGIGSSRIDYATNTVGDVLAVARGAFAMLPHVRTVIDVGSQATKVIWIDDVGRVSHFAVNEKCATGSGRFLQVIANVLRLRLEELGPLSLQSENPVSFNTGCAVFGESEAITRVSEGVPKEDIISGVHHSLAGKVASLMRGRGVQGDCALCGGGALDVGLRRCLEDKLGATMHVPERPQIVSALGAAA